MEHRVNCLGCGTSRTVAFHNSIDEFASFNKPSQKSWEFRGWACLNTKYTYPWFLKQRTNNPKAPPVRVSNHDYNPRVVPVVVEMWLCPICRYELKAKTFDDIAEIVIGNLNGKPYSKFPLSPSSSI